MSLQHFIPKSKEHLVLDSGPPGIYKPTINHHVLYDLFQRLTQGKFFYIFKK